jgi:hypothetical protein
MFVSAAVCRAFLAPACAAGCATCAPPPPSLPCISPASQVLPSPSSAPFSRMPWKDVADVMAGSYAAAAVAAAPGPFPATAPAAPQPQSRKPSHGAGASVRASAAARAAATAAAGRLDVSHPGGGEELDGEDDDDEVDSAMPEEEDFAGRWPSEVRASLSQLWWALCVAIACCIVVIVIIYCCCYFIFFIACAPAPHGQLVGICGALLRAISEGKCGGQHLSLRHGHAHETLHTSSMDWER